MSDRDDLSYQESNTEEQCKLLRPYLTPARLERFKEVIGKRSDQLTLVLDGIFHIHNISAIVRSADAFGLCAVHYVGRSFDFNEGISLGSEQWVSVYSHNESSSAIAYLKSLNYLIAVLQAEPSSRETKPLNSSMLLPSIALTDLPFEQKIALVLGNERDGANPEFFQSADYRVHIPMMGFVESLNVSVTAGICLFASTISGAQLKRRLAPLSPDTQLSLELQWLKQSIKGAQAILKQQR